MAQSGLARQSQIIWFPESNHFLNFRVSSVIRVLTISFQWKEGGLQSQLSPIRSYEPKHYDYRDARQTDSLLLVCKLKLRLPHLSLLRLVNSFAEDISWLYAFVDWRPWEEASTGSRLQCGIVIKIRLSEIIFDYPITYESSPPHVYIQLSTMILLYALIACYVFAPVMQLSKPENFSNFTIWKQCLMFS